MAENGVPIRAVSLKALGPETEKALRQPGNRMAVRGGDICLRWGDEALIVPNTPEGRRMLQRLGGRTAPEQETLTKEGALRGLLEHGAPECLQALVRDYGLKEKRKRQAIVFRSAQETGSLGNVLRELILTEPGDELAELAEGKAALLKNLNDWSDEDAEEYIRAVIGTAEEEAGLALTAGIGNPRETLGEMAGSAREAEQAIRTGIMFRQRGPVYVYRQQTLERLLAEVPPETRKRCREELFPAGHAKWLTDEMRETILAFFRNDLNLSTTARELFLHRNTLTYRLERVRRETGLDLRVFRDAAVFKVLLDLPEERQEPPAEGEE